MATLLEKIKKHDAKVAVIGIGYVGLPLCVEMASAGFHTTGYDKHEAKVKSVLAGKSYIGDISDAMLAPLVKSGKLTASTDPKVLGEADVVVICVPTPLNKTKEPDNCFIIDGGRGSQAAPAQGHARRPRVDDLPGLHARGAPAQARGVAGSRSARTSSSASRPSASIRATRSGTRRTRPRSSAARRRAASRRCRRMYGEVIDTLVPVSSTDAAEMVKLLENTFRAVNIGLVNEVAIMCHKLGLNTWEVIDAAATKPFGFMRFYPGPGLGGHCIPVDPLYLSWKLKTLKYEARFIELADEINTHMPHLVVEKTHATRSTSRRRPSTARKILVLGVAYKRDIDDVRESPALDIIELFMQKGAEVSYHDPYAAQVQIGTHTLKLGAAREARELRRGGHRHRPHQRRLQAHRARREAGHRHAQRDEGPAQRAEGPAGVDLRRAAQLLVAQLLGLGVALVPRLAEAKASKELAYRLDEAFSTAVRFVRVDRGCKVTDRDADAAYVMFECPEDEKKISRGSVEIFRSAGAREGVRLQVTLTDESHGAELRMLELLERKLREERGVPREAPRQPAPASPPRDGGAPPPF